MVTIVKHAYSVLYKRLGNHKKKTRGRVLQKENKKKKLVIYKRHQLKSILTYICALFHLKLY
jgi:hypothetical protein